MSNYPAELLEGTFIQSDRGHVFCLKAQPYYPESGVHNVIFIPPFAEEMNASRRFFALMRRALCARGYTVIQPDLYGTGDSEGLFVDATLDTWLGDLHNVRQHFCSDEGERLSVIALRGGCLLAQEFLFLQRPSMNCNRIDEIVYLQPETTGFNLINTLLRMQVTKNRLAGNKVETSALLWQSFEQKRNLCLAGYDVGYELALQMRDMRLTPEIELPARDHKWINLSLESGVASGSWREHTVASSGFWQSHDIEPESCTVDSIVELINSRNLNAR